MKKSDDLANAFLLKHYPGRSRLSASVPAEASLRNKALITLAALVITVAASFLFIQRIQAKLRQELGARTQLEQRLLAANQELDRLQALKVSTSSHAADLARAVQNVSATAEDGQKDFLASLVPEALRAQVDTGIPASLLVAVAIKESNYGQSESSRIANNLFSLQATAGEWSGQTWTAPSREGKKKREMVYRLYPDLPSAIRDYAALLQTRMQAQATAGGKISWLEQAQGIAGNEKDWSTTVEALMEKHQLQKLDNPLSLAEVPDPLENEIARNRPQPWEKRE